MSEPSETGTPFPSDQGAKVEEWSEAVYGALRDWSGAHEGEWTRWEPGHLMLTISRVAGEEVEPVQLCTADEELSVSFGLWHAHFPTLKTLWDAEPPEIAEHVRVLVERWLSGHVRTAVLTDASGNWCGTTLERDDFRPGHTLSS